MKRIWVFLKDSTIEAAVQALKYFVTLKHGSAEHHNADQDDEAAEDLKRAKRLHDTHATPEEIESVLRKHDHNDEGGK